MTLLPKTSLLSLSLLIAVLIGADASCAAQQAADSDGKRTSVARPSGETRTVKGAATKLTDAETEAALEFASKNHPELGELLQQLRRTSQAGFERGIREVHLTVQRLDRFRDKQPGRFDAEVNNWRTESKIRLLTAKWVMSQDPVMAEEIQELLRSRQQAKLDRLRKERDRLAERLRVLDQQIGMGDAELEADLVAEWDRLKRQASAAARNRPRNATGTTTKRNEQKSRNSESKKE